MFFIWFQQDQRREFLDNAKKESAARIDEAQAPFRDSVESGQSLGEATTELQFGVNDGKSAEEAIENASHELFRQSTVNAGRSYVYVVIGIRVSLISMTSYSSVCHVWLSTYSTSSNNLN